MSNVAKSVLEAIPFILIAALIVNFALAFVDVFMVQERAVRLFIAVAAFITVAVSLRVPRIALLGYWIIYVQMSLEPSLRSVVSVFGALVVVGVVAYRGYYLLTIVSVVGLSYLGSIEPNQGKWVAFVDFPSILVLVFLVASAVVGWRIRDYVTKQSKKQKDLAEIVEREKEATIKTLHDAVASTITSIILRSEVLAIDPEIGPSQRAEIKNIARDGRMAITDVHELLSYLASSAEKRISGESVNSLQEHISNFISFVASHGFNLKHRKTFKNFPTVRCSHDFHYVFRELGANIIKYAEPGSDVELCVVFEENLAIVTIRNEIATRQSRSFETTHLGLDGLEKTLTSAGGDFTSGYEDNVWSTVVEIPIWRIK